MKPLGDRCPGFIFIGVALVVSLTTLQDADIIRDERKQQHLVLLAEVVCSSLLPTHTAKST